MQRNQILKNISALMTLQVGNYLLPLILIPYLVRTLGLEVFGSWMFALAFVIVARTFVAFGFDLTATRRASLCRDDPQMLSLIYQAVVAVRLTIWLACLAAVWLSTIVLSPLNAIAPLLLLGMLILIGEAIFPVWLFQGKEEMAAIPQIKLSTRAVNLLLVVWLVRRPEDVILIPLLEAATSLAAGLIGFIIAARRFGLGLVGIRLSHLLSITHESVAVFVAQAAVHLYSTANAIVLGFLAGPMAVGQYSIAERVYSAIRGLLSPVVQAIYPSMALMFESSRDTFRSTMVSILSRLSFLLTAAACMVILSADWIVMLIAGETDTVARDALRILGLSLLFAVGSFLAPMLVVRSQSRQLMLITVAGGILGLITIFPLVSWLGVTGAALSFLIVQAYNATALIITALRQMPRSQAA
jgi:polysaccharide transporter, PST family